MKKLTQKSIGVFEEKMRSMLDFPAPSNKIDVPSQASFHAFSARLESITALFSPSSCII
jgi:hypothetical protein